jgi:hypothetical protein
MVSWNLLRGPQAGLTIANARDQLLPEKTAELMFLHGAMRFFYGLV